MPQRNRPPKVQRLTIERTDQFLETLTLAGLAEEDIRVAKMLIDGNLWIIDQLEQCTLTIAKLRRLFQVQGSEKAVNRNPAHQPNKSGQGKKGKQKPKGHGRNGFDAYAGASVKEVLHPTLSPGGPCPAEACEGRLYEMSEPGVVVRVSGSPLASATRYQQQKLRCAICEVIYTAPLPEGVPDKKYDAGFVSMLMINKYFMSVPLYRQDRLQNYLGVPLPSSTQWDLMVAHKPMLQALYGALSLDAANGLALCYDDTSVKILNEIKAKRLAEPGHKKQHNCFTTGLVSLHEDHRTYLYMTDNQVAGSFAATVLGLRDPQLDAPVVMCDALAANTPQGIVEDLYKLCYCLTHARRQFYDLPDGYDDLADEVIRFIGEIYKYEDYAKGLEAKARLAYHQKHSRPVMKQLKSYLESQQKEFEPNGVAGKAIHYLLKRWTHLSGFLEHPSAPLDNNLVEQALKLVIQTRKSSMFYKSLNGAAFASFVQSALYSAAQNNINPCHYMTALLENEAAVIAQPEAWLPWRYQQTLTEQRQAGHTTRGSVERERPG